MFKRQQAITGSNSSVDPRQIGVVRSVKESDSPVTLCIDAYVGDVVEPTCWHIEHFAGFQEDLRNQGLKNIEEGRGGVLSISSTST